MQFSSLSPFLYLSLSLPLLSASGLSAQIPGAVLSSQKISETQGGLGVDILKNDQLGRSVCLLGDLDGDGIQDIVSGAHGDDQGGMNQGACYVMFLRRDGTVKAHQKIGSVSGGFTGALSNGDQFGRAVAAVGDLDGDGVVELLVGANFDDDGGNGKGAVWILFLRTDGTVKGQQKISSTQGGFSGQLDARDEFGRSAAPLGDLDGDGVPDVAVGASYDDDGGMNRGALYVLFLRTDGTVKSQTKISSTTGGLTGLDDFDYFAHGIGSIGDFDGDGNGDLVVGSILDDDAAFNAGAAWILLLNSNGTVKRQHKISPTTGFTGDLDERDQFGVSVAGVGDIDGNGVTDIAVGAVKDDDGGFGKGAVWIVFMAADGGVIGHQKISDTQGNFAGRLDNADWFGSAVCGLGDLNLDGRPDISVGSRFDDDGGVEAGAVYNLFLDGNSASSVIASFQATPLAGQAPLEVAFSDTSVGQITSWSWNFGDGGTSTLQHPLHTYVQLGTFSISLTVTGPAGAGALTRPNLIRVDPPPIAPAAGFSAGPSVGETPLPVVFSDTSTGTISAWTWDFGDGGSSTLPSPTHTYLTVGTFSVSLTVVGPLGMDTVTQFDLVSTTAATGPFAELVPYGSGVNPADSLVVVAGLPTVGGSVTFGVDNPLGTQPVGSTPRVIVALAPLASLHSGFGMSGPGTVGELLVDLGQLDSFWTGSPWAGAGLPTSISVAVPNDPLLIGTTVYVQGVMFDFSETSGIRIGLCGAIELRIGL